MERPLYIAAQFFLVTCCVTLTAQLAWQHLVTGSLYHCTDSLGVDFLVPGSWTDNPVPVERVGFPVGPGGDTIRSGWTTGYLWWLWFSFLFVSQFLSCLLVAAWRYLDPLPPIDAPLRNNSFFQCSDGRLP